MTWAMKVAASGGQSTIDVASLRKLLTRVESVRASLNRARRAAGNTVGEQVEALPTIPPILRHVICVSSVHSTGSANFHAHPIFTTAAGGAEDQEVSTGRRQPPAPFARVAAFFRAS
jgi:hypothetical protein